ncbi:MAG: hypothetical protein AB1505_19580 [Candidatus Latescibacterota bacterium]
MSRLVWKSFIVACLLGLGLAPLYPWGMTAAATVDDPLGQLPAHGCPLPSRCPYCPPEAPPHWIRWGTYQRYAGDPQDRSRKIAIDRWCCKVTWRTFSLLPDALLPYCGLRTAWILAWLHALCVAGKALSPLARQVGVARSTLRGLQARFQHTVPQLRLPRHEAALPPAAFLHALAALPPSGVVGLFREWKEREPKHCLLGFYRR